MSDTQERWSGRLGFILATIGSAVGLGSIWKFPYEVGTNGGSVFVLFYLAGLALIVFPLLLAEFSLGRRGRADAAGSIAAVAHAHGASRHWALAGSLGVLAAYLILSFYSVIGGWTVAYALGAVLEGRASADAAEVQAQFDALLSAPLRMALHHAAFMLITAAIVARGIAHGIEAAVKVLMPILFVLVVGLAIYSIVEGDAAAATRFMFSLDFEHFSGRAALEAVGLGFFSIGVGLGLMIVYAAYAGSEISLREVALVTIVSDTAISFLAGFAIFPIVFANGLDPASGPGLLFVTLPLAFAKMPFGEIAAFTFFILLFVAALASAISMLEMPVSWLMRRFGWSRLPAVVVAAGSCWLLGLASVFSFNLWADWFPLGALPGYEGATFFDLTDQLTSNAMLPIGGFVISVFVGWRLSEQLIRSELALGPVATAVLRGLLRYVTPLGIAIAGLAPIFF
ncbi:MAG: sodium-dependent transporter [Bradyrhizobiaceae bacterium]|nr:sodium-dependent transporter [Bradyrhizobiaceae bacterium]